MNFSSAWPLAIVIRVTAAFVIASCTHLEALEESELFAESGHQGRLLEDGAGDAGGEVAALVQAVAHVVRQLLGQRQLHDATLHGGEVQLVVRVEELELLQHAGHVADDGGDLGPHLLQFLRGDFVAGTAPPAALVRHLVSREGNVNGIGTDSEITTVYLGYI